jgi:rubredoxin
MLLYSNFKGVEFSPFGIISPLKHTSRQKNRKCPTMNLEKLKDSELDPETKKYKEKQAEIMRLRSAEKFMEIDEGKFECQACGYVYEPEKGDKFAGIQPGTEFSKLPDSFSCPACRSPKSQFKNIKKVIAGFADNQKYGFGGNSLTGGQKNLIIFGCLGFGFLLLLSGYFLE